MLIMNILLPRGSLIGHPVENVRIVLTDGASHAVDSSELAFKLAAIYAFRKVDYSCCCALFPSKFHKIQNVIVCCNEELEIVMSFSLWEK